MQTTMLRWLIFSLFFHNYGQSTEIKVELKCAKQCTCTDQHMSDLPMMKWQQVFIDRETRQNESLALNREHDGEENFLEDNPFITAAFCLFEENSHQIDVEQFFPQIEALTILYARDTVNKTIEYELSNFESLIALDIQGYKNLDSFQDADVSLHHNALLNLQDLRYLNIEHVLLFPNPNSTIDEEPFIDENIPAYDQLEQRRNELEQRRNKMNLINPTPPLIVPYEEYNGDILRTELQRTNLTFLLPEEPRIISYDQFKKQQNLISTFSHLSTLLYLRLYQCHLDIVSWDMFKDLFNLQTLSLENNDIVEIPKMVFFSMPKLKILILSGNKLSHLDLESLAGLFELEHLDLSRNNFHYLSETTFAPVPKLKYVNIRYNPVDIIYSNTFEVMNATETLYVGSQKLVNIHDRAFKGLNSLQKLAIHGLGVETLGSSLIHGMPALRYLEINGNIYNIDFDAFTGSLDLEVLILKNCSLRAISVDAFIALFQLKVLDLSENHLEVLPPGIFDQLNSLTELILSHNRFIQLPEVLDKLQHIKMIRLDHNPWNCSCDMSVWRTLNLNKRKETREIDVPCTYKYDKKQCTTGTADIYVLHANVMPQCATPVGFKGYSVQHVLTKRLRCKEKKKMEHSEKTLEYRPTRPVITKRPNGKPEFIAEYGRVPDKKVKYEADDHVDNNIIDLSQFVSSANFAVSDNGRLPENVH